MIFMGYSIKTAVGVSVVQMLFSSIFGSYLNYKAGKLRINEIFVSFGGFVGAIFSGFIVSNVSEIVLEIFLSFVLLVSILKFFFSQENDKNGKSKKRLIQNHFCFY